MTLILRKLLASSTFAIYGTLVGLVVKLESILERDQAMYDNIGDLEQDYDTYDELEDEWEGDEDEAPAKADEPLTDGDIKAIHEEIEDLKKFRELAKVIKVNSKANHLITALERAFAQLQLLGAQQKALIFTESRRTQDYLLDLLQTSGYEGKVIVFNGSNNDPKSNEIYQVWLREHNGTDIITGSPSADKRAALVDYFREEATIMIATEAAAEGVNLQFCSLVVNYDLPWNPQRIEQRIGRCHRYGQKFDVVVVNFLNKKNAADIRVYELLADKFQLFDGVFGASDEVLGTIGNGTDFEKRIAQIYNECRSTEEIQQAFDLLQEELKPEITEKMQGVRTALLENFDESVRERLRMDFNKSKENLSLFEHKLWKITNYYLEDYAEFVEEDYSFELFDYPSEPISVNLGFYKILRSDDSRKKSDIEIPENTNIYRIGHKLAQQILTACKEAPTPVREVVFDYSNTPTIITLLEKFIGHSGWLRVEFLTINSFEQEEYLLAGAFTESGDMLDPETALRLFSLNAQEGGPVSFSDDVSAWFRQVIDHERATVLNENALRNRDFFDIEMDKLDLWADDMKLGLEREIKDLDAEIKLRKAEAKKILKLEDKVKAQRHIKDLERKRSESRRMLFTAQDEVDDKKDQLLTSIEKMLNQKISQKELFTIQWKIV
jgi:superfamily II DNA/RNA helicase